ncbi:LytR C-terminal domain-containing protein [Streptomyces sp. NPDC050560]|uniref:LytR C-terminal domain-containing protein n=1 Tax=Streptomyces sp. NPDC050560 TaxID=3365630 RepID=UPI0037938790
MSMLTPPGMGGKYRVTGNTYPRMRRGRRRGRIVLSVVATAVVVGLVGWGSLQLVDVFSGGGKDSAVAGCAGTGTRTAAGRGTAGAGTSAAARPVGPLPKPGRITVNVLNATPRSGLAQKTADALEKRGFKIGDVGNATAKYDKKVKGTGVLIGGKSAEGKALSVLGVQVKGAPPVTDTRKGGDVDLVIGDKFDGLVAGAEAKKDLAALTTPEPSPSPSTAGHC